MEIDIDLIMAELNQIREENREAAKTTPSFDVYKGTRDKYREAIVASGLKYNGKSPYFFKIISDDITFFRRNWEDFLHAVNKIVDVSGEYVAALLETAKTQDITAELKNISVRMNKDGALGEEPYDGRVETIVEDLERVVDELYNEIEKRYWAQLGL